MRPIRMVLLTICLAVPGAFAAVFGAMRGIIHDPQHRPVQGAMVMVKAKSSDWSATTNSDTAGNFTFNGSSVISFCSFRNAVSFMRIPPRLKLRMTSSGFPPASASAA